MQAIINDRDDIPIDTDECTYSFLSEVFNIKSSDPNAWSKSVMNFVLTLQEDGAIHKIQVIHNDETIKEYNDISGCVVEATQTFFKNKTVNCITILFKPGEEESETVSLLEE